jgi:hypothetical protein
VRSVTLGWSLKRADVHVFYAFMEPTGRYTPGASDNIGSGYWGNNMGQPGDDFIGYRKPIVGERRKAQGNPRSIIDGCAHLNNIGFYGTPQREVSFDLNDFDELAIGPWEWDFCPCSHIDQVRTVEPLLSLRESAVLLHSVVGRER